MSYLSVLPLDEVKLYLRIDDTQSETDSEITSMIKSAMRYIERTTNVLFYARDKDYDVVNGCVKVYDHPINSLVSSNEVTTVKKNLYVNYSMGINDETLTLNVGYENTEDVPSDLIDVAKVMVRVMFYDSENNQSFKELMPMWAKEVLDSNKRFIL